MGAISYKQVSTLQRIWDSLTSLVGLKSIGNPLTDTKVIDEPLTLYVSTTGNDGNPGTADRPFKTIQAQLDSLRQFEIRTLVTVQVGLGTFDGFHYGNQRFGTASAAGNETIGLTVTGTLVSPTLSQGNPTGTVTSSSLGTFTDTSQNWAPNALKGKLLYTPNQIAGSQWYVITGNTATSVTHACYFAGTLTAGWTYQLYDWGTTVLANAKVAGISSGCQVQVLGVPGAAFYSNLNITNLALGESQGTVSVRACQDGTAFVSQCFLRSYNTVSRISRYEIFFSQCYFETTTGTALIGPCPIVGSYLRSTNATPAGIGWFSAGGGATVLSKDFLVAGNTFENYATGISAGSSTFLSPPINISANGGVNSFVGCTTQISLYGNASMEVSGNLGLSSGNTTGISLNRGARFQLGGASSLTATTEITLDGVANTFAAMRQASPKLLTNTYGTIIYE